MKRVKSLLWHAAAVLMCMNVLGTFTVSLVLSLLHNDTYQIKWFHWPLAAIGLPFVPLLVVSFAILAMTEKK